MAVPRCFRATCFAQPLLSTVLLLVLNSCVEPALAAIVPVSTPAELTAALTSAASGDTIQLAAGDYVFNDLTRWSCSASGTAAAPIIVEGLPGSKILLGHTTNFVEGFLVTGKYWHFINLAIEGTCTNHDWCEHAFHITGDADFSLIRSCTVTNFNAQLKSNIGSGQFPDDCVVERSHFYDTAPRVTSNPVTKLNIDGGERWIVRDNFIHDSAKNSGNFISYQTFMKSNGAFGVYERNLVICSRLHTGQVRLGMSFGGGGTSPDSVCGQGVCNPEHRSGVMRNNVILNCNDVGIYLNEALDTKIYNNFLYGTSGIDVRFAASTADIRNNLLSGSIRDRDGGISTRSSNLITTDLELQSIFADPANANLALSRSSTNFEDQGEFLAEIMDDYCGRTRSAPYDIGAFEYSQGDPCDVIARWSSVGASPTTAATSGGLSPTTSGTDSVANSTTGGSGSAATEATSGSTAAAFNSIVTIVACSVTVNYLWWFEL